MTQSPITIRWKDTEHPSMHVHNNQGVVWLSYPALDLCPSIGHGFSTRLGGVSKWHLSSMNLSYSRGDDPENVLENYRRIAKAIGFSHERIVCSDQTHTDHVVVATEKECGSGVIRAKAWQDVDGMVTNERNVVLCTSFADCVPLYFYDPIHEAIGLSHSGWRGTVQRIGEVTIRKMTALYGTDPKDLITAIGPSICQDCYEVSEDVILEIKKNFSPEHWSRIFYGKDNGHYQLNLWEACKITLKEAGVPEDHISLPGLCTCCNPDFLFSHRASHGRRGNLNAFLYLK